MVLTLLTRRWCGVLFGWLPSPPPPQRAVWVEGATEAGLPPHPDHNLWLSSQHQRQFLPAHLRHLPPGTWEPATHCPGRHRHLHHHPEQRRDAPAHLLQGGEESQQQHGEREYRKFFLLYRADNLQKYSMIILGKNLCERWRQKLPEQQDVFAYSKLSLLILPLMYLKNSWKWRKYVTVVEGAVKR